MERSPDLGYRFGNSTFANPSEQDFSVPALVSSPGPSDCWLLPFRPSPTKLTLEPDTDSMLTFHDAGVCPSLSFQLLQTSEFLIFCIEYQACLMHSWYYSPPTVCSVLKLFIPFQFLSRALGSGFSVEQPLNKRPLLPLLEGAI